MTIDSPADVLAIIGILTALLGGVLWLIKAQTAMGKEFKPNGGRSFRDGLDRIERDTHELRVRLDQHIDKHNT